MTLSVSARQQRALDALELNHWMLVIAEYVSGSPFVRVSYQKLSGEAVLLGFEIERKSNAEVQDWIEQEPIRRLRETGFLAEYRLMDPFFVK